MCKRKMGAEFENGYYGTKYKEIPAPKDWRKNSGEVLKANEDSIDHCMTTKEAYLLGQVVALQETIKELNAEVGQAK